MDIDAILNLLEYKDSPCFLEDSRLGKYPGYSHIFRRAQKYCNLRGVYTLREQTSGDTPNESVIPLVYVCEAEDKQRANKIHKLVWNQNIVPFLLVVTPYDFRLYRGFKYDSRAAGQVDSIEDQSILKVAKKANEILKKFADFKAKSIDNGSIFQNWSKDITPKTRVDWKLLDSLKKLGKQLINETPMLPRNIAHTLIGKYVYLRYLRDRDILSDPKFAEWGLNYEEVFGRNATLSGLYSVEKKLDSWLNGSVFPLPEKGTFNELHLRKVASTFRGDDPASGQMHLDFQAYNFAHIPIETLSVVYEQFLHAEGQGREKGAYYTPIHLVNFMLDELDAKHPLKKGMKIFDASCGSGAFLVQCYRRLIERSFTPKFNKGLAPDKLSELLTDHIHGLEVDEDACGVTELSLILTLLDYVHPPDLTNYKPPKNKPPLPILRDRNIFFCSKGFFDSHSKWEKVKPENGYDWIVGNPPWKEINAEKPDKLEHSDRVALEWINSNRTNFPISSNQLAEAFAWKVTQSLSEQGLLALLMPASSLFKGQKKFRCNFFNQMRVWRVVNFSNLRTLLFRGANYPAAAFFYSVMPKGANTEKRNIVTYTPFAVDQLNRYAVGERTKDELWTIIVNDCEIKEIPNSEAASGDKLHWKLAMWGSVRDKHLLASLAKRFYPLSRFASKHGLTILEGFQLRTIQSKKEADKLISNGEIKFIKKLVGKDMLKMKNLKQCEHIFSFPKNALVEIKQNQAYLRTRGGESPLEVCYPPHIIVDAARRFSVFSNDFIGVPPRQIGIEGKPHQFELLKALSLYLSSDFVIYHQYLTSALWGIINARPNEADLKMLPIPLDSLSSKEISDWASLHSKLVKASDTAGPLFDNTINILLKQLNENVYDLLGITKPEQYLIRDLLQTRMKLNDGAIAREAVKPATKSEMMAYATIMKNELDSFLDEADRHRIKVYYSDDSAIIKILHLTKSGAGQPEIIKVDARTQAEFNKLGKQLPKKQGQWIYFNRGFKIFEAESRTTYIFKPRQRLYWLKSQALIDADEFIDDKLTSP